MNVDPDEIKKFTPCAAAGWDPQGDMRLLHQLNPLRLRYITDQVLLAGKKVLDVGCGVGLLSEAMASAAKADVTAIDLNEAAIQAAKQHATEQRVLINYQCTSIEALAQSDAASFEVVTCMELLEHVPNPAAMLQSCADCLKPGGTLFVATINRNIKSYLLAIVAAEYCLGLLPKGTHDYARLIRPSELTQWARQSGLTLQHLQGMQYHPFTQQFKKCNNVHVNYMACYGRQ